MVDPRRNALYLGLPLGVAIAAVALVLIFRGEGEPLTEDALAAARARWAEHGPRSYHMVVEVRGAQQGTHRIEVRDGEVASMTTNGEPAARSAWGHWAVEGMFRFLETELENAKDPGRAHGAPGASVELRAAFDQETGYPRRFLRHVAGHPKSIEWEISAFERR